jgi:D-threo-aldose 1-dehydrogenase
MTNTPPDHSTGRRPFGATGLLVDPLCIGCAELGNMPETFAYAVDETQALATIRAVFQGPINFIDTAASYGDGESERRIGLVLRELGGVPAGYIVATKADRDLRTGDFSGDQIRRSIERSLHLLGLDYLPLVYLHDPEHAPFEAIMAPGGAVDVMRRFVEQGVVGHIGVAGGPADLMIRYVETGAFEAVITHNRYTLLNRSADRLLTVAAERGLGVANAAPYGSGILAKGPSAYPRYAYQAADANVIERARQIEGLCREVGVPMAAIALQFSLRDPRIHSTIVGMSRPERMQQTVDLASLPIPESLWTAVEQAANPTTSDPEANRYR